MGRKRKKENIEKEVEKERESEPKPKLDIASDIKKSILSLVFLLLGILLTLGFFGAGGKAGGKLDELAGLALGWTRIAFPLVLFILSLMLVFKRAYTFYIFRFVNLLFSFLLVTGLLHWFAGGKDSESVALAGGGGGYVGYWLSTFLQEYLGRFGSLATLILVLVISLMMTFNFSLIRIIQGTKKDDESGPEPEDGGEIDESSSTENAADGIQDATEDLNENKTEVTEKIIDDDIKNNIKSIKFEDDPDLGINDHQSLIQDAAGEMPAFRRRSIAEPRERKSRPGSLAPGSEDKNWKHWSPNLLENEIKNVEQEDTKGPIEIIKKTLLDFGIKVTEGEVKSGPTVTQYSFTPAFGVKLSKITALQDNLALALSAHSIRIEAPIPGKPLVGIEVPNKLPGTVCLRNALESSEFMKKTSNLSLVLGKDVSGDYEVLAMEKLPHLLIAGATGTGKSICVNSIITTLLYQNSPRDLQFIMIDPKKVELSMYSNIPHLKTDVITDKEKVVKALGWAVGEMERRYSVFQKIGSRDIESYRKKFKKGEKLSYTDQETGERIEEDLKNYPNIVIVIDELADLMGSHGKDVEKAIVRIAQMSRAVGIHLIVSTQRPEVSVITGLIKANIANRVSFKVASQIDSRTIINMSGAEKLIGRGDMLYLSAVNSTKPKRMQGVLVTEEEVKRVVNYIIENNRKYVVDEDGTEDDFLTQTSSGNGFSGSDEKERDEMYEEAKQVIIQSKKASTSLLQRRLRIGYSRASRILDELEEDQIISPSDGTNKPREVFVKPDEDGVPPKNFKDVGYDDELRDQQVRDKWQM